MRSRATSSPSSRRAAPCLFDYGAAFPGFIALHHACRTLPYLADVARFDWRVNVAYHAPDRTPLARERLAAIAPDLDSQRRPGAASGDAASRVALSAARHLAPGARRRATRRRSTSTRAACVSLIHRTDLDVGWRTLTVAEYVFLDSLVQGVALADAWDNALTFDPTGTEAERLITTAFSLDLFTDLHLAAPSGRVANASTERALP